MDILNEVFNLPDTIEPKRESLVIQHEENYNKNVNNDYEYTRKNLYNLLEQGEDALLNALDVAKQSESARAYEVVGSLLKNLADINHQLLDLTEKTKKINTKNEEKELQGNVTNNAIFVGSTAELSKFLKNNN